MKHNQILELMASLAALAGLSGCSRNNKTVQPIKIAHHAKNNNVEQSAKSRVPKQPVKNLNRQQSVMPTKPFKYYDGKKYLVLGPLDSLGRATGAHIQIKDSQTPHSKRPKYLKVKPTGYHHNKLFKYDSRNVWVYNRGHLVGWQFSGLNNDRRNLITQTTYLNKGGLTGMDAENPKGQLYYEDKLRTWMREHPTSSLDYSVVPIYEGNNAVASYVKLTFVGYNKHGKEQRINTCGLAKGGTVQQVLLKNSMPHVKIDYATGNVHIIK